MKRVLLWLTPAILLITAGLLSILLVSETGLKWAFGIAQTQAPGQLTAENLRGRLIGPLDISGLHYRDDSIDLHVGQFSLAWRPGQLFSGRVHIDKLALSNIDVRGLPGTDEPTADPEPTEPLAAFAFELPLPVRIEQFELRDATWHPPEGEPVTVNRFSFSASARESWITVSGLYLDSPLLTLDAEGLIPLSSAGTVRLDMRFRSEINEQTWAGRTALRGAADDIDVDLNLTAPIDVLGEGRIRAFADPMRWELSAGITEPFPLATFVPDTRAVDINAIEIEARGVGNDISGSGHLALRDEEFGLWGVDLDGQWDGNRWRIDDFLIAALEGESRITGQARQLNEDGFDVDLQWEDLAWPLTGEAMVGSPQGSIAFAGTPGDYAIRLDGQVTVPDVPDLALTLEGRGDSESLTVSDLDVDWLNGQWHAAGHVAWLPQPAWDFAITAQGVEPALLHSEAEGKLDARAQVSGHFDDSLTLNLDIEGIDGILREFPFDGRARLAMYDDIIEIHDLHVRSGEIELGGNARIAEEWDIDWRIDARDLALLDPELAGRFESTGTVTGPADALRARFGMQASALSWQEHALDTLQVDADVELVPDGQWRITTRADGVRTAGQDIGQIRIDSAGAMQDHTIDVILNHDSHRFEQQLAGALVDEQWAGELRRGTLEQTHAGVWTQDATPLSISATRLVLGDYCWTQQESVVCLNGTREAEEIHALLNWTDINLDRIEAFLPDDHMTLDGATRGEIDFSWLGDQPGTLQVDIHGDPGTFSFMLPTQDEPHQLSFEDISLSARADAQAGLQGTVRITLNEREHFAGSIHMPQWSLLNPVPEAGHAIDAELGLELHDLSLLALLVPELQTGPGNVHAALDVNGTVAAPRINGNARIGFEHLELARLGIRLDDVTLNTDIRHNEWVLEGSSRMDQGILEITGSGVIHNADDWRAELALNGDNLQTLRQPGLNLVTSPAITLEAGPDELEFGGRLTIPRARIEPVATESTVPVSGDVIIIGDEISEEEPGGTFTTHGRIEIILGNQVLVSGMGFDGRLVGQLMVIVNRDGGLIGQGEIRVVDGRYRAYGQNLTISQGRILYAGGSLDNPAIDIIASRMRGDIEVGVRITGTAEQPELTLFSNPAMDDGDVLSYLVIGRPMDQAGEGDGQLLHQAATSAALVGGEALAERISERYGLDEVTIEAGDEVADTALVLGRAISDRIYIRYIQGLVENTNAFQVRYKISEKWTLETESGTRSGAGADILYSLER